jgi:hypothetical protein
MTAKLRPAPIIEDPRHLIGVKTHTDRLASVLLAYLIAVPVEARLTIAGHDAYQTTRRQIAIDALDVKGRASVARLTCVQAWVDRRPAAKTQARDRVLLTLHLGNLC